MHKRYLSSLGRLIGDRAACVKQIVQVANT
jgi:hypothetical protein